VSKKPRKKANQPAPGRSLWLWLVVAAALVLVVGGVAVSLASRNGSAVTGEGTGAPQLVVDRTSVDEGYLKFDTSVRTTFRLTNAGGQTLKILGEPQVELIEGC
jgi:hypothetical protein